MPEPEPPRLDATRRERLAALGIELLALRGELAAPNSANREPGATQAAGVDTRLQVVGVAWPASERLPNAVIAALGLRPEEVSATPSPGRPSLVFGAGSDAPDAVLVPTLAQLREPGTKRALWPALRRLRRRLATASRA